MEGSTVTYEQLYISALEKQVKDLVGLLAKSNEEKLKLMDLLEGALKNVQPDNEPAPAFYDNQNMKPYGGIELPSERRKRLTMESFERMRNAKDKDKVREDMQNGRVDEPEATS